MRRLMTWLGKLNGWRRNLFLFAVGAAGLFLFAPFDGWPLLFILIPLFWRMLDTAPTMRRAMWDAFFFGYGFFMAGTYWIALSLTVDADRFAWLIPFSLFGLSAVFALYFVLLGWLYHRLKTPSHTRNLFLFSALWVSVEYLRSIGMFGFPWNLIGYALVPIPVFLQSAAIWGIFGMSLLAMLFALSWLPLLLAPDKRYRRCLAIGAILLAATLYANKGGMPDQGEPLRIRIVQPNIEQRMKWQGDLVNSIMGTLAMFTEMKTEAPPPDIVVWPETAVPFTLSPQSDWLPYVAKWLPPEALLVTGVVIEEGGGYMNGLIAMNGKGEVIQHYAKRQLVPFGEFIPLRSVLPLEKIAPGPADFMRGTKKDAVTIPGYPSFQPMICYESAFPWFAASDGARPRWLLTITNDAWFGNSPGPYQHFAMSRVRAAEQGLPVIRAANTGISAVIDANGGVVKSLALGKQGLLDASLPNSYPPTLYAKHGGIIWIGMVLTIYLLVLLYRRAT